MGPLSIADDCCFAVLLAEIAFTTVEQLFVWVGVFVSSGELISAIEFILQ